MVNENIIGFCDNCGLILFVGNTAYLNVTDKDLRKINKNYFEDKYTPMFCSKKCREEYNKRKKVRL